MASHKLVNWNTALKLAILESGRTQGSIAEEAGIDQTRLSRIIRQVQPPWPDEIRSLSRVLGRPAEALFPELAQMREAVS